MPQLDPVTPGDATFAGYLQSVEWAVVDIFNGAFTFLGETARPVAMKFQSHHSAYADALAKLAGASAAPRANQTLELILTARLQAATDETAALNFLFGLENQLVATHIFVANSASSPDVLRLLATIVPTTAARCATFGSLARLSTPLVFPNGPVEGALVGDGSDIRLGFDPSLFPVG